MPRFYVEFCRAAGFSAPLAYLSAVVVSLMLVGCDPMGTKPTPVTATSSSGNHAATNADALPPNDEILRQIDDALDYTYEHRRLSVKEQAAWQIIHGALAFKRDFQVSDGQKDVSAVDYVLQGGQMRGWNLVRGELLDEATMRYGVRALLEEGTKTGQGHADQWMGYLSDCGLPLDEPIVVDGKQHTLRDYLEQIERDVHLNPIREYSWTLMALTAYRPTDYQWKAGDGSEWSIPKMVEIELEHSLDASPCGGTHRMTALTMAYNRHVANGGKVEGVWEKLKGKIIACIEMAEKNQNPDGSLSSNYFARPGKTGDLTLAMGSGGHVLEFLTVALDKEELQQPWVKRALLDLCKLFRKTKPVDVECGALFHAAHGLVLYREKVFGPRTFGKGEVAESE